MMSHCKLTIVTGRLATAAATQAQDNPGEVDPNHRLVSGQADFITAVARHSIAFFEQFADGDPRHEQLITAAAIEAEAAAGRLSQTRRESTPFQCCQWPSRLVGRIGRPMRRPGPLARLGGCHWRPPPFIRGQQQRLRPRP
jgi:hypothetical protein